MKKILSLLFIFCIVFNIFSTSVQAVVYENRADVDNSTDTRPDALSLYDVLCQLPKNLRDEILPHITEKSSVKFQNKYYSVVGFEAYQAISGLIIVRRQDVKKPDVVYYDFILSASEHTCYTRTNSILSWDGTRHFNGFIISSTIQMIRLNTYDKNGVGHFQAYPISGEGGYEYTDAGDMYACDIVFCSKYLVKNDGVYEEVTYSKTNDDINSAKHFNWGDHLNLDDKLDILLEEEYNISEKTSILNIRINKFALGQKLFYSNVMFGIDGTLKTKEDIILDPERKSYNDIKCLSVIIFPVRR